MKSSSSLILRRSRVIGSALAALVVSALVLPIWAHEIVLLPQSSGDLIPVADAANHLTATPIDFGTLLSGHTVEETLTLVNDDSDRTVTVTPDPPAAFTVSPGSLTLAPAGSADLQLTYVAGGEGPIPDLPLPVTHDDVSVERVEIVTFVGSVVDPDSVVPQSIDFGDLLVLNSLDREVTIANASAWPTTLTVQSALPSGMSISPSQVTVPAGGSGAFTLTRDAATQTGTYSGSVDFEVTFAGVAGSRTESLSYSGEIVSPPQVQFMPSVLDFGAFPVNETAIQQVSLNNQTSYSVEVAAPDEVDEELEYLSTPVLAANGGTASFDVTYDPLFIAGPFSGTVYFEVTYQGISGVSVQAAQFVGEAEDHVYTPVTSPRGYRPNQPFQTGEIDSIDTASGNVTVRVPLGQTYEVGPMIRYQFTVVNNSNAWDFLPIPCGNPPISECVTSTRGTMAIPNAGSNAGLGWELHFGKLYGPEPPTGMTTDTERSRWPTAAHDFADHTDRNKLWLYVAPDGAKHFLHQLPGRKNSNAGLPWRYSKDGSFLRMRQISGSKVQVDFPDGRFAEFEQTASHLGTDFCGYGVGSSSQGCWRLKRIADPFGNEVTFSYYEDSATETESWTVRDSTDRQHVIRFDISDAGTAGGDGAASGWATPGENNEWGDLRRVVKEVTVAAFSGSATYGFSYSAQTIDRTCPTRQTSPNEWHISPDPDIRTMVLTQISMPEESPGNALAPPWKFVTDTSNTGFCGDSRGKVTQVTLPTRGKIEYVYSNNWEFPTRCDYRTGGGVDAPEAFYVTSGIRQRKVLKPNDTVESEWTYSTDIFPNITGTGVGGPNCERAKYRETTVDGPTNIDGKHTRTVSYHSIWEGPRDPTGTESGTGWQVTDRGLPYTKGEPIGGNNLDRLFLSSRTYQCTGGSCGSPERSTYRRYVSEFRGICDKKNGVGDSPDCFQINPIQMAERTVFHDDGNKYVETRGVHYDGVGHFRTITTKDDFSGSVEPRTVTTEYSATNQFQVPNSSTGYIDPGTPSSYLPTVWILTPYDKVTKTADGRTYVTEADFTSGVLSCSRSWKYSGTRSGQDLVVKLALGGTAGVNAGLPTTETVSGGEFASISTSGAMCKVDSTSGSGSVYTLDHTYKDLQLASTRIGTHPYRYRADINQATGLPSRVYNEADEGADLDFDLLGRLTSIIPDASRNEADTFYTYSNPVGANPSMKVERKEGGDFLSIENMVYDHLGRQIEHGIRYPVNGWTDQHTKYDGAGNVITETTRQAEGSLDNLNSWRHSNFDAFGRVGTTYAPDGQATHYAYDGIRRQEIDYEVETDTGTKRRQRITVRDGWGRTISDRYESVYQTDFDVDPNGRVVKAIRYNASGQQERVYGFDARGYLLSEDLPEVTGVITYKPDAFGLPRRMTSGGHDLKYIYDSNGRIEKIQNWNNSVVWKEWEYGTANSNDGDKAKGRLVEATRYNYPPGQEAVAIVESYQHRAGTAGPSHLERQVQWIDRSGNDVYGSTFLTTFDYDGLGNLSELAYPLCVANPSGQGGQKLCNDGDDVIGSPGTATWAHAFGLVTNVDVSNGVMGASYTYHPNLQVATADFYNGIDGVYDEGTSGMVRPRRRHFKAANGATLFDTGTYGYDGASNIKSIGSEIYKYDGAGRLLSSTVNAAGSGRFENYQYDTLDNMTSVTNDLFTRYFNMDPATNRIIDVSGTTEVAAVGFTYDNAGNVSTVNNGAFSFDWDALNMQTRFTKGADQYISVYGPGDYRVWVEDPSGVRHWTSRGPDGKILREYQVTGDLDVWTHQKDFVYGAEGILSSRESGGTIRYFHSDHLGTPRLFTSGQGGNLGQQHFYPFGRQASSATVAEQSVLFTGHQRELHGDADYMLGRHYLTYPLRFASVDPGRDGWNLYSYAANNPVKFNDPTGLYLGATHEEIVSAFEALTPEQQAQFSAARATSLKVTGGVAMALTPGPEELLVVGAIKGLGRLGGALLRGVKSLFGKADILDAKTIRFSQDSIRGTFKDGRSVSDLAADLRSGRTKASDVEPVRVFEKDGQTFTLDNRRLHAFQEAGVPIRTVAATAEEIAAEAWKFTTKNGGISIRVRGGG